MAAAVAAETTTRPRRSPARDAAHALARVRNIVSLYNPGGTYSVVGYNDRLRHHKFNHPFLRKIFIARPVRPERVLGSGSQERDGDGF